jgi:glycerol-3-phosphate acyltransferase PlsX
MTIQHAADWLASADNVALKAIEGTARRAGYLLESWLAEAALDAPAGLKAVRHDLNPQHYNGAGFVGLAGVVAKSHGAADAGGFRRAIEEAILEVDGAIPARLTADFEKAGRSGASTS